MKKKGIIIGVCCACVVVLLIILVAVLSGGKSPKATAKNLGKALESKEKLEKFAEKNIDFKALVALNKVMNNLDYSELMDSSEEEVNKKISEEFKKEYKDASKDDVKDMKEKVKESIGEEAVEKKLKVKEIGELETEDDMKEFQSMKVTYEDEDGKEYKFNLSFYKKKLVTFSQDSSYDFDQDFSYDADDADAE